MRCAGQPAPVVHVVEHHAGQRTIHAGRQMIGQRRDMNDFVHTQQDRRDMAFAAGLLRRAIRIKSPVAGDQSTHGGRSDELFSVIATHAIGRHNGVKTSERPVAGAAQIVPFAVPDNDALGRNSGRNQALGHRGDHRGISGRHGSAGRGNLDTDAIVGFDEDAPCRSDVRLPCRSHDQPVNHAPDDRRIETFAARFTWIFGEKDIRPPRGGRHFLRADRSKRTENNEEQRGSFHHVTAAIDPCEIAAASSPVIHRSA